jgi:hypothetical protein
VVHAIVEADVWEDQESVRSKCDTVVHAGEGQGERWQGEVMSCHGMVSLGQNGDDFLYPFLSILLGKAQRGQRGTKDDLGSMV